MKIYIDIELFRFKEIGGYGMSDYGNELEAKINILLNKFAKKKLIGIRKIEYDKRSDV